MEENEEKCVGIDMNDSILFPCVHCNGMIQVFKNEFNCCIFRHAILKDTKEQINPHTPKDICDKLIEENKVEGCAKPFRIVVENEKVYVEKCDYI
jgi:hypothetical protein